MAIAIDASTPAPHFPSGAQGTSTGATPSFSPPANSLLVCFWVNAGGDDGLSSITDSLGTHLTYTKQQSIGITGVCSCDIWTAPVGASAPGSMTATGTTTSIYNPPTAGLDDQMWAVAVVTGQAASPIGAGNTGSSTSGTPSLSLTTTGANSLILGCVANFTSGTLPTLGSGQSTTFGSQSFEGQDNTNGSAEWAQYLTGMNLGSSQTATLNDTAPTGIEYTFAMLEILAAAGAAAAPPQHHRIWPQAMWRSAYR